MYYIDDVDVTSVVEVTACRQTNRIGRVTLIAFVGIVNVALDARITFRKIEF